MRTSTLRRRGYRSVAGAAWLFCLATATSCQDEITYYSPEATRVVHDLRFIHVEGEPFFALGVHGNGGLVYDGVSGEDECDQGSGRGYLPPDTNLRKHQEAARAGANFMYLWGYGRKTEEMIAALEPRPYGKFHSGYGIDRPAEEDLTPIFYNEYGEVDLGGYDPEKAEEMRAELSAFMSRTGSYSPELMPNLPPVEQVGHMAWHPTYRMKACGACGNESGYEDHEMLTDEQARDLARTTNMMIGDTYTYVENRWDLSDPAQNLVGTISGQKGDKGEDYDSWLATDDRAHQDMFSAGFDLARSLRTRSNPETVVWMWIQGYSFGDDLAQKLCEGGKTDHWAVGGFPHIRYLRKEILSVITAGATGIVFFGFPYARPEQVEVIFRALRALDSVYHEALIAPRLDLGIDTTFVGEQGWAGKGRAHLLIKWHEESRTATVLASNPGARPTHVELSFPWSLARAQVLDWETARFEESASIGIEDRQLSLFLNPDDGAIIRITPEISPFGAE